jgi:peptidoglycan/LPS O-acetylase OafA/YrhL
MNPKREDLQAIRAREKMQAIRIREGLQKIRPHFGWTFGIAAFTLLGFSVLHFYSKLLREGELSRLSSAEGRRTLTACCVLFGAGLVYAMAWWTTRKVQPPQRAWGIAASLLSLAFPLYVVYVAHKPMRISEWEIMAYGALALFIYGWPDRWVLKALSAENRPNGAPRK